MTSLYGMGLELENADAGYKIWAHMLTPFSESEAVTNRRKRVYNRLHSRTQIAVECASGRLKNRFRILLGKLEQKTPEPMKDSVTDPLRAQPDLISDDGGLTESEQPFSHSLGILKRNDLADTFMA
ncbi:DDE superfamily endonuclease [Phytophthora infestans]|uniref:DDE superfamily endonuclease n=1 Tax=Phytophthora infestans TaxID=4787 RepID=A0A8S9TSS0_PHYIN|nr:DDE superfamily endonuclease [Phytophthora infestans]